MNMRSLFEFNHDKSWRIDQDPDKFLDVMEKVFRSGYVSAEDEGLLDYFGVTYYGSQHHSTPCRIEWNGNVHATGVNPKVNKRHKSWCSYGRRTGDASDWCNCQGKSYRP